jgi:hypothetical protein
MLAPDVVASKVESLRRLAAERDVRMRNVQKVRSGDIRSVIPGFFPEYWPAPVVANHIDVVARDLAEQIGKMPTLTCVASVNVSNLQKKFSIKRTRIAHKYAEVSNLKVKLPEASDWLVTYGFVPFIVEPDFDEKCPRVRAENPVNAYPEYNIMGECISYAKMHREPAGTLAAKYPHLKAYLLGSDDPRVQERNTNQQLTLVRYVDDQQMLIYVPERHNLVLLQAPNLLGVCPVVVAKRSQYDDQERGAMDDVMWIQMAKNRLALFIQEGVEKAVTAPVALPKDVRTISFGPDAVIQTDNPEKVQKLQMNFPPVAGQQMQSYEQDLMMGSRYPGTRAGQSPGSIVTGQGVNALEGGFDSQTMNYQSLLGFALKRAFGLAFALDELLWKNTEKELRVMVNGSMFEEKYTPSKDIAGIHEIEVTYGFAAGMDPNRALVFLLQMMSAGLADRDFVLQQMPFDLDSLQTLQRVDIEKLDDALKQGIFSMATSIGVLIEQGQDPTQVLQAVAKTIELRQKGVELHKAVLDAFKQPAPQAGPQGQPGTDQTSGPGGGPLQQALMGGSPLQPGVAPGQQAPGGRPDLMQMLAGLSPGGQPNVQANLQSRQPVGP